MAKSSFPSGSAQKQIWRGLYGTTAGASTWLAAHQWRYGPEVAKATALDVRHKLNLQPDDLLVEIGAGSGAFLACVLHEGQMGVGFDYCDQQINAGRRFGVDASRIKLGVAEAAQIPLLANSFDKVLCYSVMHYFPDDRYLRAALFEMLRICRVGGTILLGDVAGVMERTRKTLLRAKCSPFLADTVLLPLLPLRSAFRKLARKTPREGRYFRRSFLHQLLKPLACRYEILDQDIPGRPASRSRFDIRLTKIG